MKQGRLSLITRGANNITSHLAALVFLLAVHNLMGLWGAQPPKHALSEALETNLKTKQKYSNQM